MNPLDSVSSSLLSAITGIPGLCVFRTDIDGKCAHVNDGWTKMSGLALEEAKGIDWIETIHIDDRKRVLDEWNRALKEGVTHFKSDFRFSLPDGTVSWVATVATALEEKTGYLFVASDITARKQAEDELRSSSERCKFATAAGEVGAWDWSPVTGDLVWNDEVYRIMGLKPQSVTPSYDLLINLIHPDYREYHNEEVNDSIKKKKPLDIEYAIIRADGKERMCHAIGKVLYDGQGEPARMMGTIQDITERKESEKALLESENKYRLLVKSAGDAIFLADATTGVITDCNEKAEELIGRPKNEIIGMRQTGLHPAELAEHYGQVFKSQIETGKDIAEDLVVLHKDGRTIPVDIRSGVFEIGGRPYIQGSFRDIREKKKAEEALVNSEERYRTLVEGANLIGWEYDTSSDQFTFVSGKAEEMTGYPPEEWKKKGFLAEHIHPDDRDTAVNFFVNATGNCEDHEFEYRMIKADGGIIWCRDIVQVVTKDGKPVKLRGILINITERKLAEESLRNEKEKAVAVKKEKEKYVSLIAHDLKAPFTSIIGFLELMENQETDLSSRQIRGMIQEMKSNAVGAVNAINEILHFSRFQSGDFHMQPQFFDGSMSVASTIANYSFLAQGKGIEIINDIPEGTRLYADKTLFREVMQNLLGNAVKFCNRGDRIRFYVPEDQYTTIAIEDTGVGISGDTIANLFRSDIRTTTAGTNNEVGTGLGLPFCQEIMLAHEGEITVESKIGEGSVFYVTLPFVRPLALIVDDDKIVRYILQRYMQNLNVSFIEAADGIEAMEKVRDFKPDLVLLDIFMPTSDGFQVLKELKSNSSTSNIPVIVLTSDNRIETREKVVRMGVDDFVGKPVRDEEVIPRVRKFLI